MNNKKNILTTLLISIGVSITAILVHQACFQDRIVSVDILRLIDNYKLRQDLEGAQKAELDTYIKITDSLKNNFEQVYRQNPGHADIQALYNNAIEAENELEAILGQFNEENNKKIWTRLNPVIDRFAEEMDYDLVVGANGMGTVLYMKKTVDVTDQLIKYINDEYEDR